MTRTSEVKETTAIMTAVSTLSGSVKSEEESPCNEVLRSPKICLSSYICPAVSAIMRPGVASLTWMTAYPRKAKLKIVTATI